MEIITVDVHIFSPVVKLENCLFRKLWHNKAIFLKGPVGCMCGMCFIYWKIPLTLKSYLGFSCFFSGFVLTCMFDCIIDSDSMWANQWSPCFSPRSRSTEWDPVFAESFSWVVVAQHVAEVNKSLHAWEQSNNVSSPLFLCFFNILVKPHCFRVSCVVIFSLLWVSQIHWVEIS